MPLEKQVTSLELSKKLENLGVKQDSLFYHDNHSEYGEGWLITQEPESDEYISAFTVAELGELLPAHIQCDKYQSSKYLWSMSWNDMKGESHNENANTEVEARGLMLVYLLENGLL